MSAVRPSEGLIDQIHEAGLVPSLWPALLADLGAAIGGNGGAVFAVRDGYARAVNSPNHDGIMELFMHGGWSSRDKTLPRALALNYSGFISERELFSEVELDEDEVYRQFFRKYGLDYRAGTIISLPVGDTIAVTIFRTREQGAVQNETISFLDGLRPYLARAALTASRFGFERALAQAEALQTVGLPGAMLRASGQVVAVNALFEQLVPSLFLDRSKRLVVADTLADAMLANALLAAQHARKQAVWSIPVAATLYRRPMIMHLIPVCGAAHDIFAQADLMLVVTPVDRATIPSAEVLQGLFDLTPAEARVARSIGDAQTVDTIALALGVSRETVRSQVKAVLSKTGLSRQQELISLLAGNVLPGAGDSSDEMSGLAPE